MNLSASTCVTLILSLIAGCTSTATPSDPSGDKSAAAANKADWSFDVCAEYGWYGDMECDLFCPVPDPDCDEGCVVDEDCPQVECNFLGGPCPQNACIDSVCVFNPECQQDVDCPMPSCLPGGPCPTIVCSDEYECVEQEDECRVNDDCPQPMCLPGGPCPGNECIGGACVFDPQCRADIDCPQLCAAGGSCIDVPCVDYECVLQVTVECIADDDCPQPMCLPGGPCPINACVYNECVQDPSCRTDEDCPQPSCLPGGPCPQAECIVGECYHDPQCRTDEDCPQPMCLPGGPCPTVTCDDRYRCSFPE